MPPKREGGDTKPLYKGKARVQHVKRWMPTLPHIVVIVHGSITSGAAVWLLDMRFGMLWGVWCSPAWNQPRIYTQRNVQSVLLEPGKHCCAQ